MKVRVVGTDLPGATFEGQGRVHVGVQRAKEVVDLVPGDADEAVFEFEVEVRPGRDGNPDFFGPYVHGRPGARFLYLSWGSVGDDGSFDMFRRAKLWLSQAGDDVADAGELEARLRLSDGYGGPTCGGLAPERVDWIVRPGP